MLGKQKCRVLKEIRQRIADENDIPWVTGECRHQGECRGTCPKCESELRELERQLAARQAMGKRVTVAALCAGLAFASVGCTRGIVMGPQTKELEDEVPMIETPEPTPEVAKGEILMGEIPFDVGEIELEGDIAWEETAGEPVEEEIAHG